MDFTPQQEGALKSVSEWLKSGDHQVFRLFGYAGTGKSTLAKHFAEGVGGEVLFAAFTGKAAHVMQQKGCPDASTIHSLIYHPKDKSRQRLRTLEADLAELRYLLKLEGGNPNADKEAQKLQALINTEREALSQPAFTLNPDSAVQTADLVIIDECSMVDSRMGSDLLSFGTPVLVIGDPAQLPPVGGAGFFTNGEPDVALTEIHRQARDNPIIRLATEVREQRYPDFGDHGGCNVIRRQDLDPDLPLKVDQMLVGKNATRAGVNRRARELLFGPQAGARPLQGDKVVCLRNNHELGLLNGSLWNVDDVMDLTASTYGLDLSDPLGGAGLTVEAADHYFNGNTKKLMWWEAQDIEEFDYGYALTVHKSQGSQWDNVLLFDESHVFRSDKWRWLYTGVTRAAEHLTVVKM